MNRNRAASAVTAVTAAALYLAVSGVGPVLVSDLGLILAGCATASVVSCLFHPGVVRVGLVWFAGTYPYFLSRCSDTLHSTGGGGGLACPLSTGSGVTVLLGGIPASLLLSGALGAISYALGRWLYERKPERYLRDISE